MTKPAPILQGSITETVGPRAGRIGLWPFEFAWSLVTGPALRGVVAALVLAQTAWADIAPPPGIKRLDDATRAKALAALAGLIILGFGLVLLTWLGARVVQRYRKGTSYHRPTPRPGEHDWARRPLAGSEPDSTDPS